MFRLFRIKGHIAFALTPILFFTTFLTNSQAATFYTSFTVGGFPVSNGNPAPDDPVSGTIVWTAPDIHSDIQSFVSISLTIHYWTYYASELGFFHQSPNYPTFVGIGDTINESGTLHHPPGQVDSFNDDFSICWDSATLQPVYFSYATYGISGGWTVWAAQEPSAFQSFTVAAVPEPGSLSLLLFGLLGLLAWPMIQRASHSNKMAAQIPLIPVQFRVGGTIH